jgi:hypothetical protein
MKRILLVPLLMTKSSSSHPQLGSIILKQCVGLNANAHKITLFHTLANIEAIYAIEKERKARISPSV